MATVTHEGLQENLRFLILEVRNQISKTAAFLREPTERLVESVLAKDDYIDNLKSRIQRKCFELAAKPEGAAHVDLLKAMDAIAVNLERIADFCENIIDQAGYFRDVRIVQAHDFAEFFDPILAAIGRIDRAIFQRDVQAALKICRSEYVLDRVYAKRFHEMLAELGRGEDTQTLVTLLFIYRYLERMGDALLNVGEAVISACLGEQIKIDRFWALEESLDSADLEHSIAEVELEPIGETRSGCNISRVRKKAHGDGERSVIFKEGRLEKLRDEKRSIERWQELVPGLVPQIYSFHDQEDHGSILFEYLTGNTFEELLLDENVRNLEAAIDAVCDVMRRAWVSTRTDEPVHARFMKQLLDRLPDVLTVHPDFREPARSIGGIDSPAFEELVRRAAALDDRLPAPFSVFIHGDFNVDNIIFSPTGGQVHFIDLHRSRQMDYVQDASVLLVSNYRLQVFEAPVRRRINSVIQRFHAFFCEFAHSQGDTTFQARLALGLARSFATSTRFVLGSSFAKSMFMRSRYLLERLLAAEDPAAFRMPGEVLVD